MPNPSILALDQLNTILTPIKQNLAGISSELDDKLSCALYTHTKNGKIHTLKTEAIVDTNSNTQIWPITFLATADFVAGDEFNIEITSRPPGGDFGMIMETFVPRDSLGNTPTELFVSGVAVFATINRNSHTLDFKPIGKGGDDTPFSLSYKSNQTYIATYDNLKVGDPVYYGYQFHEYAPSLTTGFAGQISVVAVDTTHFMTAEMECTNSDTDAFTLHLKMYEFSSSAITVLQHLQYTGSGYYDQRCLFNIASNTFLVIECPSNTSIASRLITVNTSTYQMTVGNRVTIASKSSTGGICFLQFPGTIAQFYFAYYTGSSYIVSIKTVNTTSGAWTSNMSFSSHSTVTDMSRWTNMGCITSSGYGFIEGESNTASKKLMWYKIDLRTATNSAPNAIACFTSTTSNPYNVSERFYSKWISANRVLYWKFLDRQCVIYNAGSATGRPTVSKYINLPTGCTIIDAYAIDSNYILIRAGCSTANDSSQEIDDFTFLAPTSTTANYVIPLKVKFGYPCFNSGFVASGTTRRYICATDYLTDNINSRDGSSNTVTSSSTDKRIAVLNLSYEAADVFRYTDTSGSYTQRYATIPANAVVTAIDKEYDGTLGRVTITGVLPDVYTNQDASRIDE